jgi:hypothetical protein
MAVALFGLLVFAMWLALHGRQAQRSLTVGFTAARGHFPEPPLVVAQHLIVAWVTNTERSIVVLDLPSVLEETSTGQVVTDQGSSWNQEGSFPQLALGSSAWLAGGFDGDTKRLKFVFDYHRDGGATLKIISRALGVLPLRRLPGRIYDWLRRHGMIDGAVHDHYESPWFANNAMHLDSAITLRFHIGDHWRGASDGER